MPCPPPSHISTAQYSFLKLYAPTPKCFQTLNPSFLVHMASHMVLWWIERPPESTIKSIIVPLTNMGYLGSLKNPELLYILRHSSVTALFKTSAVTHKGLQAFLHCRQHYSKLQQSHIKGCKHVLHCR